MKYYFLFFITVKSFSIPDASEGVFYDRSLDIYFDEKVGLASVTKETVRVTDSKGKEIPGKPGLSPVPGRVLAPSRTKLTFLPRHGWPVNETITVEVTGLKDDMDNVMDRVYRTSFKTYAPR
ncbi:MAG: Ig-like domain-containing protein, partial [Nitrospirae bacterium]|nr:Ig-like domain-containing protein [Nitrospirota bacterium]